MNHESFSPTLKHCGIGDSNSICINSHECVLIIMVFRSKIGCVVMPIIMMKHIFFYILHTCYIGTGIHCQSATWLKIPNSRYPMLWEMEKGIIAWLAIIFLQHLCSCHQKGYKILGRAIILKNLLTLLAIKNIWWISRSGASVVNLKNMGKIIHLNDESTKNYNVTTKTMHRKQNCVHILWDLM